MKRAELWKGRIRFFCPGCKCSHMVPVNSPPGVQGWTWNERLDLPTLSPSLLTRWEEGPEKVKKVCHSYVTDGKIQFLVDSTHALAGKTVDLGDPE